MSTPYLSEIKIISWNFAPKGWAFCNGQLMPISQNQALFSLLGTTYGGDGRTTYGLPNMQARMPIHQGGGFALGQASGEAAHILTVAELPTHNHAAMGSSTSINTGSPANDYWGDGGATAMYSNASVNLAMAGNAIGLTGSGQPHANWNPYLALNYIIALTGIFPSQN